MMNTLVQQPCALRVNNRKHNFFGKPIKIRRRMNKKVRVIPTSSMNTKFPQIAEKLNGRMAMVGFLAGSSRELVEGVNYIDQLKTAWPSVLMLTTMLTYATITTRNLDVIEEKPFTTDLELLNGRLAMLGVFIKFVYDLSL